MQEGVSKANKWNADYADYTDNKLNYNIINPRNLRFIR